MEKMFKNWTREQLEQKIIKQEQTIRQIECLLGEENTFCDKSVKIDAGELIKSFKKHIHQEDYM